MFRALWRRKTPTQLCVPSRGLPRRLLARRSARVGFIIAGMLGVLTLFVPVVLPHRPERISLDKKLVAPGIEHPLGTDHYGRDQFARIADGGRLS